MSLVALPTQAELDTFGDAAKQLVAAVEPLSEWMRHATDQDEIDDLRAQASALAQYAEARGLGADAVGAAQTVERRAEMALGRVVPRHDVGRGKRSAAADLFSKQDRSRFREMAEHEELIEGVIARLAPKGAATRAAVLRPVRDHEATRRRVAQAMAEAAAHPTPGTIDIRDGDFRDVLTDLTDIDAIITDPPYPAKFLPLLADLAVFADKVLTENGVLAVLIGQTHLPDVYRLLTGERPYRWTACYLTTGAGYVSHARKVQSNWKPLIVYGGGPRFGDLIRSDGDDKSLHRWGQDYGAFHTIVERLTSVGQTIVDPFMGSGTTLLAGHALGRNVIGCDTDPTAVATTQERLL